jgi:hypothetical protein
VRAHGVVTARNPHARRCGDALDGGVVGTGPQQGATGEHRWGPGVAPGKTSGGGAHRGGRATVGWQEVAGAVAFRWEGGSGGVVLWLAVEAGEVAVGAASESGMKTWRGG